MNWLEDVYHLVSLERLDDAVDILFDGIDDLLCEGKFSECDAVIQEIDFDRMDSFLVIAALSITLAAWDVLPSRPDLVRRARERLMVIAPDRIEGLMGGLVEYGGGFKYVTKPPNQGSK